MSACKTRGDERATKMEMEIQVKKREKKDEKKKKVPNPPNNGLTYRDVSRFFTLLMAS